MKYRIDQIVFADGKIHKEAVTNITILHMTTDKNEKMAIIYEEFEIDHNGHIVVAIRMNFGAFFHGHWSCEKGILYVPDNWINLMRKRDKNLTWDKMLEPFEIKEQGEKE